VALSRGGRLVAGLATSTLLGAALGAGLGALVDGGGPASAATGLVVQPSVGLVGGQVVTVTASGLAPAQQGWLVECNDARGQPTEVVDGWRLPVGCTEPAQAPAGTDGAGGLSTTFVVRTGTVGPPAPGTDSTGGDATTDAAAYPCPPTPSQEAGGLHCDVVFIDPAGDQPMAAVTFAQTAAGGGLSTQASTVTGPSPPINQVIEVPVGRPGTRPGGPPTTIPPVSVPPGPVPPASVPPVVAPASGTSVTTVGAPVGPVTGPLAFTGPGRGLWVLAALGAVLADLGYLVLTAAGWQPAVRGRWRRWAVRGP